MPGGNWVTVGYRFPPGLSGSAFWQAMERLDWNEARGTSIAWKGLEVHFGRR